MIPYEWVNRRGDGVLSQWTLEPRQRRQLKALLVRLEGVDYQLAVNSVIFKKGNASGIYYCKINGNEALRPRCCLGPELNRDEFEELRLARAAAGEAPPPTRAMRPDGKDELVTFLERVNKKGNIEAPLMKDSQCSDRLLEVQEDRTRRRRVDFRNGGTRK